MSEAVSDYFLNRIKELKTGCIHSVFSSSFNIQAGDFLVHAGTSDNPLSCLGFNIAPGKMREILPAVSQGDLVKFRNSSVCIYSREKITEISWNLLPVISLKINSPCTLSGTALKEAIIKLNLPGKIGITLTEETVSSLALLRRISDEKALEKAFRFLIGRGKGLTPSGDDIITGFCAGLWAWGDPGIFCSVLRKQYEGRTTDVSCAYLRAVTDGYVNEDYKKLFTAVKENREEDYQTLVEEISRTGHTSGCDSLLGLLAAIETVQEDRAGRPAAHN